jgi:hypothetical protein
MYSATENKIKIEVKSVKSLDKNFFFITNFINQLFGNRSFEPILSITQF